MEYSNMAENTTILLWYSRSTADLKNYYNDIHEHVTLSKAAMHQCSGCCCRFWDNGSEKQQLCL